MKVFFKSLILACFVLVFSNQSQAIIPSEADGIQEKVLIFKSPEKSDSKAVNVTVAGKYRGRSHNGNGSIKVRCRGNGDCFTMSVVDGDIEIEFPNGDILRHRLIAVGGDGFPPALVGEEPDPSGGTAATYTYTGQGPWDKWNTSTLSWDILPIEDFWISQ